jgi:photosystem I subunit 11
MSMDVISHTGDPQDGHLSTPVSASGFSKAFIQALPAYRQNLSPARRGLEVGMAHGYLLYGPFALLGPLRATEYGDLAGLLASVGLVSILTICLSIYGSVGSGAPLPSVTAPQAPADLATQGGWSEFAGSFLIGGCGGAFFAYFLCTTPYVEPLVQIARGVWSS